MPRTILLDERFVMPNPEWKRPGRGCSPAIVEKVEPATRDGGRRRHGITASIFDDPVDALNWLEAQTP